MNIVEKAVTEGAEYADLRHDIKKVYTLIRENKRTTSSEVQINAGYCLRVLIDGAWGTGMVTAKEDLPALLQDAVKSARAQKRKNKVTIKKASSTTIKSEKKAKKRVVDEDVTDVLTSLEGTVYDQSDRISSSSVSLTAIERWMRIITSEERVVETNVDRINLRVGVACKHGSSIESRVKSWGNVGGMEYVFNNEDAITKGAAQLAKEADILVEAQHSPSAVMECVLSTTLTGTLLHEAFGHGVEADLVVSNESLLAGKIGEKVAAPCITMEDDPTKPLLGYYLYDHEGVKAQPTLIVKEGVLKSFLHSRETASKLDAPLTGHCKAELYSYTPIVRQGNTILHTGDHQLSELLDIDKGLFLGDSAGGQVNVGEGTFTFGTQYTREIKNGELGNYLKGCSLSGNVLETMQNVDAVGKTAVPGTGGCGKGQMDYQGRLMPYIRVKEVMIGGRGR
jgi:TldD protein